MKVAQLVWWKYIDVSEEVPSFYKDYSYTLNTKTVGSSKTSVNSQHITL